MKNSLAQSNQRLADRLMAEGRISPEAHATVVAYCSIHGGRVEDALIDNEVMSEGDLLRYVSTAHGTRFVSSEKLYKAAIDARILQLVPKKLADQHGVMPVMVDDKRVLSVVTADPDDLQALAEVKVAAGVREVAALVARPAAVRAAIMRAYYGDPSLFAQLMRADKISLAMEPVGRFSGGAAAPPPQAAPVAQAVSHDPPVPARDAFSSRNVITLTGGKSLEVPGPPVPPAAPRAPDPPNLAGRPRPGSAPEATRPPVEIPPVTLTTDYVETLNVLVSLLENSRPDLRGHSALCARLVKKVCDRMGLPPAQTVAYVVGAYLHDLGKAGTYHLTALNVAEYDGHKTAAQKAYTVPERFLQAANLHPDTKATLSSMYERFDGRGFPAGLAGKDIPLGGRIVAVLDTYADLTSNPRNPARKMLKPGEATEFLSKYRGTVFDPTVLDLVRAEVAGEDLRAKLLADRHNLLIVDPDPEDATLLELRLLEAGFDVRVARTLQQAVHEMKAREIAVVVSEVDLDTPDAGLTLKSSAASEPWGQSVLGWVMHTRKQDRQLAEIVFELGVDDLVTKPTPPDVFVTKLRQLIERKRARVAAAAPAAARGVSGSLAEMGLPEVVQILWHGRKSCTVRLKTAKGAGEIGFLEGQIVDARYVGARGEEAFYKMLTIKEGDFQIDPTTQPKEQTIDVSPEGLLLEGMRRLDEGLL